MTTSIFVHDWSKDDKHFTRFEHKLDRHAKELREWLEEVEALEQSPNH